MQYVYVIGSHADGHKFIGPFDSPDETDAVAHYYGVDLDACEAVPMDPRPSS